MSSAPSWMTWLPQANTALRGVSNSMGGASSNYAGGAGNALGVLSGLQQGGMRGDTSAAINAAQLANRAGAFGSSTGAASQGLGEASSGLGILSGLEQGGVKGDASAAANAAQLGSKLGAFGDASGAVGSVAGDVAPGINIVTGLEQGTAPGYTNAALGATQLGAQAGAFGAESAGIGAAAGALGLALAPAIIGMETPPVYLSGDYWRGMTDDMQKSTNKSQFAGSALEALNMPQSQVPQNIQQMVYQSGLLQPGQAWGMGPTPTTFDWQTNPNQGGGGAQNPNSMMREIAHDNGKAVGGSVKNTELSAKLRRLYESSFANRKRHYDDGGGVDYFTPTTDMNQEFDDSWSPATSGLPTLPTNSPGALNSALGETGLNDLSYNGANASETQQAQNSLNNSSLSSGGALSGLGSLLGVSNMGQLVQKYGALAPLLTGLLGQNKPASAPATPAGYGAIPSIPTPANPRSYTQPNVANWYTYGQGPEQSFFSNNQLPTVPGVSPAQASSAASTPSANTQPLGNLQSQPRAVMAGGGSFDSTAGDDYVPDPGHGDGTSDGIDAKLSGGEYVMDAGTVATLGNGSNEAGARALDQLRARVRKHAGKQLVKGKQFMKAKAPQAYLQGKGGK